MIYFTFLQKESLTVINWFCINCMQAHPGQFKAIGVEKQTHDMKLTLKVSDTDIKCEYVVKLLGVDIHYQHISNLCRKAGQQLNVLKRSSPFLSRLNKLTMFHTIILSNINYSHLAWHIYSESNSNRFEKTQECALRFVYDDFDSKYEGLLDKANIPFLHIKRLRTMAIDTFRILNNMSPSVLSDLVRVKECSTYNFKYQNILQVPKVHTTKYGKKSFRFAAAVLWNSFHDNFRQESSFNFFKVVQSCWLSFCLLHVYTYRISSRTNIEPGWLVGPTTAGTGCMPMFIICNYFSVLLVVDCNALIFFTIFDVKITIFL